MTSSFARGPRPSFSLALVLSSALGTACGEESFEATSCAELPQYNIRREANPAHDNGLPDDKRANDAKKVADDGCITVPKFESTLTDDSKSNKDNGQAGSGD